jgi:hypothetical protein
MTVRWRTGLVRVYVVLWIVWLIVLVVPPLALKRQFDTDRISTLVVFGLVTPGALLIAIAWIVNGFLSREAPSEPAPEPESSVGSAPSFGDSWCVASTIAATRVDPGSGEDLAVSELAEGTVCQFYGTCQGRPVGQEEILVTVGDDLYRVKAADLEDDASA